jgi:hypothetical protein
MIIKATLFTLILILIIVITTSYYVNKEGFDDITNNAIQNAIKTVSPDTKSVPSTDSSIVSETNQATLSNVPVNQEAPAAKPQNNIIVPEVSISGTGYDAMNLQQRMDLLKDIQKIVKNEVLASRSTTPIVNEETKKAQVSQNISGETEKPRNCSDTDSTVQGKEYENSCYKGTEYRCPKNPDGSCPPVPDMTQYIKKDAIPCWGCSLDY